MVDANRRAATIPRKREGKFYAVVLRGEGYSTLNVAKRGALGGKDTVPIPDFGAECVCCDSPTDGMTIPVELTDPGGHFQADPVDAPVCERCKAHAKARSSSEIFAACMLCVGVPLSILGFVYYDNLPVGFAGVAIAATALLWVWRLRTARLRETQSGHHPGLTLMVAPRQLVVRTTNRNLVQRVVERNAPLVHRVR
jgi:hypothetical protein